MKSSIVTLALLGQANAWWGNGHLLVARVAYELLDQQTIDQVEDILSVLKKSDPSWTHLEGDHPFVECVTFADDIKYKGGSYQSGWHFIDTPFLDEGGDISDFPEFKQDDHTVEEAITGITQWINKEGDLTSNYEYEQIMSHGVKGHTEADGLSTAMRLLMHYTGDIHQPLHATSRVDKEYPAGDRGGNSFPVPSIDGAKNLHSVWDSVVYAEATDYKLPLSSKDWTSLSTEAKRLISAFPIDSSVAEEIDPTVWANDSFKISQEVVYSDISEGEKLSDAYVNKAKIIAQKQVVIGGHRLASQLKSLNLENWTSAKKEQTLMDQALSFLKF